jgi:hypothetical protein
MKPMGLDAMLKEPVWHALPRMAYLSSLGVIRVVRKVNTTRGSQVRTSRSLLLSSCHVPWQIRMKPTRRFQFEITHSRVALACVDEAEVFSLWARNSPPRSSHSTTSAAAFACSRRFLRGGRARPCRAAACHPPGVLRQRFLRR